MDIIPHQLQTFVIPLFFFFFLSSTTTTSTFNFCSTTTCDPRLSTLVDIANAFENTTYLAKHWNRSNNNDYCFWVGLRCDGSRNITDINLRKYSLMGTISPSFSLLTSLRTLLLDGNKLTGRVPESLTKLPQLRYLDISNNNISGPIPQFVTSVQIKTIGNPDLLKRNSHEEHNSILPKVIPIIAVVVLSLVAALFVISLKHCIRLDQSNLINDHESSVQIQTNKDELNDIFSVKLLRRVTNNFDEANILGRGGSGVVYSGELHNGRKIAIKRMDFRALGTKGNLNEFQSEVDVLTRVRHRHLVALLAHCINGNERFLVYEYMAQGNLTQHLFDWEQNGYSSLTWKQRITIALDVARGVEYLHNLAQQSFIHRDLKPSNILLDDDMRAKVSDFGLVRNAPQGQSSLQTQLAGTFGYLAPEYAVTGRVTTKVDIYAFGAILMELVTGRRALDNSLGEEQSHLVMWFRRVLMNNENIQNVIDQTLNLDEETINSIQKVVELARHCTNHERHQRPDMNYVVNILSSLIDQWTPTPQNQDEAEAEEDMPTSLLEALQRWQAEEGTFTFKILRHED